MMRPSSLLVRDGLLSIPAAAVAVMAAATNDWATRPDSLATQVVFVLYAIAVLTFRRLAPATVWKVALVGAAVMPALVLRSEPSQVVLAFAVYTLLASTDEVAPVTAAITSYVAAVIGAATMDLQLDHGLRIDTFLMPALSVVYGVGLGAVVAVNRRTATTLAERNAELVAMGELARREAVLAERSRIARDLHDIVAHHVSGIVLHARSARDALDRRPDIDTARDALDTVAASGSEALDSMRGLLDILRDGEVGVAPQPGLGELAPLVASVAERGLAVSFHEHGEPVEAPTDVQLSAYRIVQEALTNSTRHAAAGRVEVTMRWEPDRLHVVVDDNGIGPTAGYREGHGLVGMRERAALVGGSVGIGSSPSGGWRVEAELPFSRAEVLA